MSPGLDRALGSVGSVMTIGFSIKLVRTRNTSKIKKNLTSLEVLNAAISKA